MYHGWKAGTKINQRDKLHVLLAISSSSDVYQVIFFFFYIFMFGNATFQTITKLCPEVILVSFIIYRYFLRIAGM